MTTKVVDHEVSAGSVERRNPGKRWVVVYDGSCGYCRRQIEKMRVRDFQAVFEFISRDAEGILERFPALATGDFNTGMRVVSPDGRIFVGADAVYEIARRLSGWRHFAWVYWVPGIRAVLRFSYEWVARNRYRLGRPNETCSIGSQSGPKVS